MIFRAYVNKPALALYPEHDTAEKKTPPIAVTLKMPLTEANLGQRITYEGRKFRIDSVSNVYEPKMVGETDSHGDYRIVSTTEVVQMTDGAWLSKEAIADVVGGHQ